MEQKYIFKIKMERKKSSLITKEVKNGADLKLTIDSNMQSLLYNQLENDKGVFSGYEP